MQQQRLWTPAPEVVNLHADWQYPEGWHLRVAIRRSGEDGWEVDGPFVGLTSRELLDVADAVLEQLLSGADGVAGSPP